MPIASRRGRDERAAVLPHEILPVFDDVFVHSCDLFDEFVGREAERIARETGLVAAAGAPGVRDLCDALARAGFEPHAAETPARWILDVVALRRAAGLPADLDPAEIAVKQEALDPRALPSYRIVALAADSYPDVLRGTITGERALFAADHVEAWHAYFSNDNPLYAVSNAVAAFAAAGTLHGTAARVLELGGGLGSGAEALLDRLEATGAPAPSSFLFTEASLPFLRRAQRKLSARSPDAPLRFARLDMDRPFAEAGVAEGSFDLVVAVNVLHVARDLSFTLGEIRQALAPGGALVAGECVRTFPGRPVHVELVFNLLDSFRAPVIDREYRPNGGFLTPEQWTTALERNGFTDAHLFPDIPTIRDAYPQFVSGAVLGRRP